MYEHYFLLNHYVILTREDNIIKNKKRKQRTCNELY